MVKKCDLGKGSCEVGGRGGSSGEEVERESEWLPG